MNWISVKDKKPKCRRGLDEFGTPVLAWPVNDSLGPERSTVALVYYGRRVTGRPAFYLYGALVHPTHWMPLPEDPRD